MARLSRPPAPGLQLLRMPGLQQLLRMPGLQVPRMPGLDGELAPGMWAN